MKKLLPFYLLMAHFIFFGQDGPSVGSNNNTNLNAPSQIVSLGFAEEIDHTWMSNLYNSPLYKSAPLDLNYEEFTTDVLKKRLRELNNKTPFQVEYNATIERFIRLYLKTRKGEISDLMDKAKYYFPIFEEHLDKYDLPLEIKYLAIVESALKPNAKSVVGARGIWQFMYHTGKQFGLNVNSYVDERSDPLKATEAACKYLKSLYDMFNDWDLALAAYNSGPGNVSKAIRRSGGLRNYWNIRRYLPAETRGYLPAFYTTFYLFEYGAEHRIYPKKSDITFFETDTIHIKKKLTFSKIKKEIGIDHKLLVMLNPQYKLSIIPFSSKNPYVLTLPKNLMGKFLMNERKIYNLPEVESTNREPASHIIPHKTNSYVVQQGDNLPKIAKKFDITLPQLKNWNGLQTNYLIAGQSLVVSSENRLPEDNKPIHSSEINKKATTRDSATTVAQNFQLYTVKAGESLFMISKRFSNVSIHQIRNWNNIWGVSYLEPGTQLKILTFHK